MCFTDDALFDCSDAMPVDNDVDVTECEEVPLPEEFMYKASTLAVLETAYFNAKALYASLWAKWLIFILFEIKINNYHYL